MTDKPPLSLAVLISGGGTTLRNLINKIASGDLSAEIRLVVSSNRRARGLEYAEQAAIPTRIVERQASSNDADFSAAIFGPCRDVDVDLVAPMKAPSLVANVDDSGSAKSINITTDGFTVDEADAYIATIKDQFGDLDNFEINGETLSADEVDIITTVVPTGDATTPFKVEVVIKPKDADANLGKINEIAFVPPPVAIVEGAIPPPPVNFAPDDVVIDESPIVGTGG